MFSITAVYPPIFSMGAWSTVQTAGPSFLNLTREQAHERTRGLALFHRMLQARHLGSTYLLCNFVLVLADFEIMCNLRSLDFPE